MRADVETVIRPRRGQDVEPLSDVLREVYARDGYPVEGVADPVSWLTDPGQVCAWSAVRGGQVVGNVALFEASENDPAASREHELHGTPYESMRVLARLFVGSRGRGVGAGRALTETAMSELASHKFVGVLDVMEKDQTARHLYERLGWEETGRYTHHGGGGRSIPAVTMRYSVVR